MGLNRGTTSNEQHRGVRGLPSSYFEVPSTYQTGISTASVLILIFRSKDGGFEHKETDLIT